MARMEQIELDTHRAQLTSDVTDPVGKYRAIFEWDVPRIDELASDKLILGAICEALDAVEASPSETAKR